MVHFTGLDFERLGSSYAHMSVVYQNENEAYIQKYLKSNKTFQTLD